MEQSKAMEYESRKASSDVLKPRNIYIYIYIYKCVVIMDEYNVTVNSEEAVGTTECLTL